MQTVLCPHCKKEIEISEALTSQMLDEERIKFQKELEQARLEEKVKTEKRFIEKQELIMKDLENERKGDRERIEKLMQDILKANEEMRTLKRKDEERELEQQKKLIEEREKMKEELSKSADEKAKLKLIEKDQQLEAMKKTIEELQRKSQQGSQQQQGEALEVELEQSLKTTFPTDLIEAVQKGVRGADVRHTVKTSRGNTCGVILWELKRTKAWSDDWIRKLKEDLRTEKANIAIIVSESLPEEARSGFGHIDGIIICSLALSLNIAEFVRQQLIAVARERFILEHKNNKTEAEDLFAYITSHTFLQQLEAFVELHTEMTIQVTRERAALEKIWKTREIQIQKMFKSTMSIAGSLQGIIGQSLPQIKGLELLEEGE
jgi:hypothetical protein